MRFSLRTLLLHFTMFAVVYGVSLHVEKGRLEKESRPNIAKVLYQLDRENVYTKARQRFAQRYGYASVNFLNKTVSARDLWGNRFVAVALDENDVPLSEIDETTRVGYYSRGQDGKSVSHGNDPDDLNSWQPTPEFYETLYREERDRRAKMKALQSASLTTAISVLCLTLGRLLFRKRHKTESHAA
jgi:hypothetical protein